MAIPLHESWLAESLSITHMIPPPPTVEQAKKDSAAMAEVVEYFKANGVRIVNMSWGESQGSIESALELNGIGETAESAVGDGSGDLRGGARRSS